MSYHISCHLEMNRRCLMAVRSTVLVHAVHCWHCGDHRLIERIQLGGCFRCHCGNGLPFRWQGATASDLNRSFLFYELRLCAITAILLQQNALGEDLTSIGSLLPLLHNLTQASLGMAFFRDTVEAVLSSAFEVQLQITPALLLAMTISPVSIWLPGLSLFLKPFPL